MFISRDEIKSRSGKDISQDTLALANSMIETYIGKDEAEVEDSSDLAVLAKATMFQAIYIDGNDEVLEQAAITAITSNSSTITFASGAMAPHMSPWAVRACKSLSWYGTRSVKVGKILDSPRRRLGWLYE